MPPATPAVTRAAFVAHLDVIHDRHNLTDEGRRCLGCTSVRWFLLGQVYFLLILSFTIKTTGAHQFMSYGLFKKYTPLRCFSFRKHPSVNGRRPGAWNNKRMWSIFQDVHRSGHGHLEHPQRRQRKRENCIWVSAMKEKNRNMSELAEGIWKMHALDQGKQSYSFHEAYPVNKDNTIN